MTIELEARKFSEAEIDHLDSALDGVPDAHLDPPYGLREFVRDQYLEREGTSYPTVMGLYSAETGSAYVYDDTFRGQLGERAPKQMLPGFSVQALIGCSVASDRDVLADWNRAVGREGDDGTGVYLLERGQIETALRFEGNRLIVDIEGLESGIGFAIAYAAFRMFPEELRKGSPVIYQHMYTKVFRIDNRLGSDKPSLTRVVRV